MFSNDFFSNSIYTFFFSSAGVGVLVWCLLSVMNSHQNDPVVGVQCYNEGSQLKILIFFYLSYSIFQSTNYIFQNVVIIFRQPRHISSYCCLSTVADEE